MKRLMFAAVAVCLAATAFAAKTERPNILFCIADDASFQHFGANGCSWIKTPNFDRIAKEGMRFSQAYTPNPKCSPSRSCIITGRNPWQLEAAANHVPVFPAKFKSVCESLRESGYETALTGKGWGPGEVTDDRVLIGDEFSPGGAKKPATGVSAVNYAKGFEMFMSQRDKDKPFFFWYGCREPHRGYEFKSGVNKGGMSLDMLSPEDIPSCWPDIENVRHDILDYGLEVQWFDTQLGLILKSLEDKGLMDNTLIIVTSDNGMPFPRAKGHPYLLSSHMPFVAMWKDKIKDPGRTCDQFVSFTDLAPTFLDVAGISYDESGMKPFAGRSMLELFNGVKGIKEREVLLQGRERNDVGRPNDLGYPIRSIRIGDLIYLHNFNPERWPCGNPETGLKDTDGGPTKRAITKSGEDSKYWQACFGFRPQEEMYDVSKDPDCMKNLLLNPEYREKANELKAELFKRLKAEKDPRMDGKHDYFDQFPYMGPTAGFYDKHMMKQKEKTSKRDKK